MAHNLYPIKKPEILARGRRYFNIIIPRRVTLFNFLLSYKLYIIIIIISYISKIPEPSLFILPTFNLIEVIEIHSEQLRNFHR